MNNLCYLRKGISEIKLKRTDTTLDLSQKALEKGLALITMKCRGGCMTYKRAEILQKSRASENIS